MKNTGMDGKFQSSHWGVVKYVGLQVHDISLHKMNYFTNDTSQPISICFIFTSWCFFIFIMMFHFFCVISQNVT